MYNLVLENCVYTGEEECLKQLSPLPTQTHTHAHAHAIFSFPQTFTRLHPSVLQKPLHVQLQLL